MQTDIAVLIDCRDVVMAAPVNSKHLFRYQHMYSLRHLFVISRNVYSGTINILLCTKSSPCLLHRESTEGRYQDNNVSIPVLLLCITLI